MSKNLLKYNSVSEFNEKQGDGDVVTSIVPGVAYIVENGDACFNAHVTEEDEPNP